MRQQILTDASFERYRKATRRVRFLAEMEQVTPWRESCDAIEPFYPKVEGAGRSAVGMERMLCIHFPQHWFNLSGPAVEEALYDSRALCPLLASTWVVSRCRTKRRCASSAICWRRTYWAISCLP